MPPKSSQRTSLGSSQPQPFQAAITKLCNAIDDAKIKTGEIKPPSIVNKLKDCLKEFRSAGKELGSEFISEILTSLESDRDNLSSRLHPATFCTVVGIALQSEPCLDGERVLFLLAESLFNDARDPKNKEISNERKDHIGKTSLQQLLKYFLDGQVAPTMRRWAGMLCVQLFQDSEENCALLELGPKENRQNIGRLVVDEPDEILRIIYAQLVRTLHKAEVPLSDLFPEDFEEGVYADFPPSTQDGYGWGGAFQNYMEALFGKQIVEFPDSIGALFFGSAVALIPDSSFGVPGHNVYIFVHDGEISILSPAQATSFTQILDIELRSIQSMAIIDDAYSQQRNSEVILQIRENDGSACFLDSETIRLSQIYLTLLPGYVEPFKDELIGRCPGLKVVQAGKKAILNPTSSNDRKPPSQVTEEIVHGAPDGGHTSKKPLSKPHQEERQRRNSIPETQVEQDEREINTDVEDERPDSVNAVTSVAQDKDDDLYDATPQTAKELFKVTPSQSASGSKSTIPARNRKAVKPKAKPPINQRGLRNKPDQEAAQEHAPAQQIRTRAKQKPTEPEKTTQQNPASQAGTGKQKQTKSDGLAQHIPARGKKQSEPVATTQRTSAGQSKKIPVNSQPNRKTRSTRSSQVTDNNKDSDALEKSKSKPSGTQKASVGSTSAHISSSKNPPGQPRDPKQNKSAVKRATKPSQARKDLEFQDYSDDFITTPDEVDTSTPKLASAVSHTRKKTPVTSTANTQTNKSIDIVVTASQKHKRYSLNPPPKFTPITGNTYDLPLDDNDKAPTKTKGKKSVSTGKSAPKATGAMKATSKTRVQGAKVDAKKRQSAPAALDRHIATRNSQRATAAKAKEQLRNADKSDAEDAEVEQQSALTKPKTAQKGKSNTKQGATKAKVASKDNVIDKVAPAVEEKGLSPLPQQDPPPSSSVHDDVINHMDADDFYNATPKKPSKKSATQKLQISDIEKNRDATKSSKVPNEKKRNSGLEMASKLGDLLGDLSDNPPETELRNSTVRKELEQSVEPIKRKPAKVDDKEIPIVKKSAKLAGHKSIATNSERKALNVEMWEISDDPSSPAEEREQSEGSPPAPGAVAATKQSTKSLPLTKTKTSDENVFKKPAIPMLEKKAPISQDKGESSTSASRLIDSVAEDEPECDEPSNEVNDDVITEATHDTPVEVVSQDAQTGGIRRKRKTEPDVTTPPKRQRARVAQALAKGDASQPSSLPLRAKPSPKQSMKLRESTKNTSAIRTSPRLIDRAKDASKALHQATAKETPTGKDPDRKPHLISFGGKGALNQGVSGTTKVPKDHLSTENVQEENSLPVRERHEDVGEKKRKRERLDVVHPESPPNKRQSISPMEASDVDGYEGGDLTVFQQSSAADTIKTKSTHTRRSTRPPTRPSSQASKVDKNGSPIASSQEDHFGKLRERLAVDKYDNQTQVPGAAQVDSPVTVQPRRLSEIFGPKVGLGNKSKGQSSSLEETASRYVAHEKTANGVYQEVASKQVVAPEKKLQDPFTEKARKSSGFTERLMSGSSTGDHAPESTMIKETKINKKDKAKALDDDPTLPLHPRGIPKANRQSEPIQLRQQVNLPEKTHVEMENHHVYDQSMPSDMTMGTSYGSQSSEASRLSLSESPVVSNMWNIAVRPHYTNLHDAIHKIADEVIIRLTDEEDRMGLLVEQYKQEGGKIIGKLEQRHQNERVTVMQALDQKKMEMVSNYSDTKALVLETANDLKESSTSQFEREWRRRQEAIRDEISDGRKVSEI